MKNPWDDFGRLLMAAPYVLPEDAPYIAYFNQAADCEHSIVTGQIPEPWLGNPREACLIVLQLNPRYLGTDPLDLDKQQVIGMEDRLHFGLASGNKWWRSCFRSLALDIGRSCLPNDSEELHLECGYRHLASRVCSVEYFPYGSDKYAHSLLRLPSQNYSFQLVRGAVARGAFVAVMKGKKEWFGAIPELCAYKSQGVLTGYRGAKHFNRSSCQGDFYDRVLCALLD